jgi:capsular polysaccharide biosynthesis protein
MSTTNYLPNAYEEIDLLELFIKIYKFFKRRFLLILIVMVICVGLGVLANLLVFKPCYQTNMIFTSRSMTTSEIADITNSLNNLVKEENWEEIQKLTGLSKEISKDIKKLEAIPNREFQKNIEKDTRTDTTMTLILEITNNKNL